MIETTIKIEGMMCPMCENHVNETIRNGFNVKSVKSSHKECKTVITSKEKIEAVALEKAICALGYKVLGITEREIEKKGFFSFLKR